MLLFMLGFLSYPLCLYGLALYHSTLASVPVWVRWTQGREERTENPHQEAPPNAGKICGVLNYFECLLGGDSKGRQTAFPRYGLSCVGGGGTCTYGPWTLCRTPRMRRCRPGQPLPVLVPPAKGSQCSRWHFPVTTHFISLTVSRVPTSTSKLNPNKSARELTECDLCFCFPHGGQIHHRNTSSSAQQR